MMARPPTLGSFALAGVLVAGPALVDAPDGIELRSDAVVLFGSPDTTTRPASIVQSRVLAAAPETETIRREGVQPGSARYELLVSHRLRRVRGAVAAAACDQGFDCVVRKRDIASARGLKVVDITDDVVKLLPTVEVRGQ